MKLLLRNLALAGIAAITATAAQAQPEGCYTRHYSADHLASQPDQVVANIWVNFDYDAEHDQPFAAMGATTSDGGHVKGSDLADRYFDQWLICYPDSDPYTCAVECDGGSFQVVRDTFESIDIRLDHMMLGDVEGCGGAVNIGESVEAPTTYRLFKSAPDGCVVN